LSDENKLEQERLFNQRLGIIQASKPAVSNLSRERASTDVYNKRLIPTAKKILKSSDPKQVTVDQRLSEFPSHHFKKDLGKLFCSLCNTELSLKKSSILNHLGMDRRHTQNVSQSKLFSSKQFESKRRKKQQVCTY